jgi:hypothetical protein
MGYDLVAYFDVDQQEIENFIEEHEIDRNDYKSSEKIAGFFKEKYLKDTNLEPMYGWNKKCGMHELLEYYGGTNFIRDDDRMSNRRYQKMLEEKVGSPFPDVLENINWNVRDRESAIAAADAIDVFFPDDDNLPHFAEWLRTTAKFCSTYELSY